jgi:hypothetical protein
MNLSRPVFIGFYIHVSRYTRVLFWIFIFMNLKKFTSMCFQCSVIKSFRDRYKKIKLLLSLRKILKCIIFIF